MKTLPSVSFVIVNWNGKDVLLECLDSIFRVQHPLRDVIVVDNGSTDGSPDAAEKKYGQRIELIRNASNKGAPAARNQGMKRAVERGVDFVFALDNDLTVAPDAVSALLKVMDRDPRIAMVGALIFHHDRPNVIFSAGHLINWTQ